MLSAWLVILSSDMSVFGAILSGLGGIASIVAGIYPVTQHGAAIDLGNGETGISWFEVIRRGSDRSSSGWGSTSSGGRSWQSRDQAEFAETRLRPAPPLTTCRTGERLISLVRR